jgi:DNA-directed RNA polymerase subunit RPC12/RpoP
MSYQQPPPQGGEQMRVCLGCGRQIPVTAYACQYCGKPVFQQPKPQTNYGTVGGIFCILSGVLGLITGVVIMVFGFMLFNLFGASYVVVCGVIMVIFSLIAILGGIFAIQRRSYPMAIVGSIFALLVGFPAFFIGFIFGIIALIFVILAKHEFD